MSANKCDILVADDHKGVRRLLFEVLSKEGYVVELAASGKEAVEEVQKNNPRVVLMDIRMPGLDGLETLKKIRRRGNSVEIVLMTAYEAMDIIREAKKLGVSHFITKPFDIDEIRCLVRTILAEAEEEAVSQRLETG